MRLLVWTLKKICVTNNKQKRGRAVFSTNIPNRILFGLKRNELSSQVKAWRNLKGILRERSQSEKAV